MLDEAVGGFVEVDRAWRLVDLDERAASLTGTGREALLGQSLWDAYPLAGSALEAPLRAVMANGGASAVDLRALDRRLRVALTPNARGVVARLSEVRRDEHDGSPSVGDARGDELGPLGAQVGLVQALAESERLYRTLFNSLDDGFCIIEMLFDDAGEPTDYRFIEVNPVFELHTGLRGALGKTARELVPDLEAHWFEIYGSVAKTGQPTRFVEASKPMDGRWFDVYAFRLGGDESRWVALHFTDITRRKRAEDELRHRGEQFQTLIEEAPLGVYLVDADFRLAQVNATARPVFGAIPDLIGSDFGEVIHLLFPNAYGGEVVRMFRHTLATGEPFHSPELAELGARADGTAYYDWRINRILLPDGRYGVVCYFSDVTESVEARRAIADSEERYRTLFTSIDEGFCILEVIFDDDGSAVDYRYLEYNPAFEQQSGLVNALGRTIREMVPDIEPFWMDLYGSVAVSGEPMRYEDHAQSMGRWFDVYAFRIGEPHEHKVAVIFNDVSERKRTEAALRESEAQLHHRAHHDPLTGLPNRLLFEDRLRQAVAAATRHGRLLAVFFIDLDGFKLINDSLGHAAGDAVLEAVAERLRASLREVDTLARLHGDEFAVILPELSDLRDAERLAADLLVTLAQPIVVAGKVATMSASIGVSVYPRDGRDAGELVRASDVAMYRAKVGGKNDVRVFAPTMRPPAIDRAALVEQLGGAAERGEIEMCYQPQWDSRTGSISTFEALLRWTSPVLGEVSPERFVPIAEERGAFGPILVWSLDACGAFAQELSDGFGMPVRVALNVTPVRLVSSGFVDALERAIGRYGLGPQQLELELAMSVALEGPEALRDILDRVRALGVRVTLDRFGAEAAMIPSILDLPLDGVKIDAKLVQRADRDPRLRRGLASVVGLVHDLGLEVTAVGVETESQRDLMLEFGCERLQGTLFGAPMDASAAAAALREQEVLTLF
jgi:diguanylate cyclase (GGDEF)-like protein/PAS domain S-box-containing protein